MADKRLIQKNPDPLFEALGTAMSQWQGIESTLYEAFHNILGADQKYSAYLYFETRSPERKVKMVDDLFRLYLGEKRYTEKAKEAFKRIGDLVKERNNLAHFCVQAAIEKETDEYKLFSNAMYFPYLHPSYDRLEKYEYRADDIFAVGKEFMEASWPITRLLNELFPSRTGPTTSRELTFRRPQRRSGRGDGRRSKKVPPA